VTSGQAVVANGLRKAYGDRVAVDGIDLVVGQGECFGFLGPNGAGKTTTMRMLSCLSSRDGGDLSVLGLDPDRDARALKARLGVVPQEINLDLELTVLENMLVYARYFGIRRADAIPRARELLTFVGLDERATDTVDRLSGGMQRRLQIARALVNDPDMILLDEPTTGLDPQARHLVWDRLRALRAAGASVIITTHYMDEAERLCDRLVVIDHGRVIRQGSPRALVEAEVGHAAVELRIGGSEAVRVAAAMGGRHVITDESLVVFGTDAGDLVAAARRAGVDDLNIAPRLATLEDLFISATGHALRDDGAAGGR